MYLNEIAWNAKQDNPYIVQHALHEFLKITWKLACEYHLEGVYVGVLYWKETQDNSKSLVYILLENQECLFTT